MITKIAYKSQIAFGRQGPVDESTKKLFKDRRPIEKRLIEEIVESATGSNMNFPMVEKNNIENNLISTIRGTIIPMLEKSKLSCKELAEKLKKAI